MPNIDKPLWIRCVQPVHNTLDACAFTWRVIRRAWMGVVAVWVNIGFMDFLYQVCGVLSAQVFVLKNKGERVVLHDLHRAYRYYNKVYKGVLV